MTGKRLTLRTLLAYLDDTLAPADIKAIGEKVNENKTAQEMIDRIKKLIRRRRLTTPPMTGPDARFDANTIAEYLDNELESKDVHELEDFCREEGPLHDLYLAEVASAHQILTLVLGEPITVPTPAKQRMYGLVKGRESIPYRKPAASSTQTPKLSSSHADMDIDDASPLLGLTPRKQPWLVWAVPAIAALLLVCAGLALYFALPRLTDEGSTHVVSGDPNKQPPGPARDVDPGTKDRVNRDGPVKDAAIKDAPVKDAPTKDAGPKDAPGKDSGTKDAGKEPMMKEPPTPMPMPMPMMPEPMPMPMPPPVLPVVEVPAQPSEIKAEVGTYSFPPNSPTVLVQKRDRGWVRLTINEKVNSTEPLVAMPGSACTVKTNGGAQLLLRGFVPQFGLPGIEVMSRLMESSVTLHQNSSVAADLTLHRGRLQISNDQQPVAVIVRFGKEAWVITLTEPRSEVGIDLVTRYTPQINYADGEEPLQEAFFLVLKGRADLKVDTFEYPNLQAPPAPGFYAWNNKGPRMPGPVALVKESLVVWNREIPNTPEAAAFNKSVQELHKLSSGTKQISTVLKEMRLSPTPSDRLLAIYSLGSVDLVSDLLDALGDEEANRVQERDEATFTIRRWVSRDARHNLDFYDAMAKRGILIDKGYTNSEAQTLVSLLHGFSTPTDQDDLKSKLGTLLLYMQNNRLPIRHVAHYLLDTMTRGVANKPDYNAGKPPEARKDAVNKLTAMLESGALTPMPMRPGIGQPMPPKP